MPTPIPTPLPGVDFSGATPVNGWMLLISAFALVISLGAAIVGGISLYRTIRYTPKPRWKLRAEWIEDTPGSQGAYRGYFFDLVNVGNGPAYDVEVEVVRSAHMDHGDVVIRPMDMNEDHRGRSGAVNPGEHLRVPVGFYKRDREGYRNPRFPRADFITAGVGLKVSYRMPPKTRKVRSAGPFMIDDEAIPQPSVG